MKSTGQSSQFVFVCYSRADMEVVDRVIAELEKQGHHMWMDRTGIVGSQTWRAKIVEAMQQCRAVLFFGSRASYDSRHVATELTLAEEALKPIVPVLLDDTPPEGDVRYFLARLHHLKLCGDDESCAIQVIHDTLVRINDPSGDSGSPLPLPQRRQRWAATRLIFFLALTLVAAAAWSLWNYYNAEPGVDNRVTGEEARDEVDDAKKKPASLPANENLEKPQGEPGNASREEPADEPDKEIVKEPVKETVKEPQKDPFEKPREFSQRKKPTGSDDPAPVPPAVPPLSETAWMVPGTDAVVIQAMQRGLLTTESGGVLQLSVDYDIGQTVRIQKQSGERIQISSSLPGMGIGWLKKEEANQYLKRKP